MKWNLKKKAPKQPSRLEILHNWRPNWLKWFILKVTPLVSESKNPEFFWYSCASLCGFVWVRGYRRNSTLEEWLLDNADKRKPLSDMTSLSLTWRHPNALLHIWINTLASVTVRKKILESRSLAQLCLLPSLQIVMHNIIFARLVHVCELLSALISSNFWTTFFLPTAFIKDQSVPHRFVSATPNKEKNNISEAGYETHNTTSTAACKHVNKCCS